MRRARRSATPATVELFPFLAVLMCALGALILLLLAVAHHARVQALRAAAVERTAESASPAAGALAARRVGLLEEISGAGRRLDVLRDELARVETLGRDLAGRLAQLRSRHEQLGRALAERDQHDVRQLAELARLQAEIAAAEEKLDNAQSAEASQESYAIIPYQGPHETRRRPLYIECRSDRIVLQPEGIILTDEDLQPPLGPANPLASGVRAAAEHLARHRHTDGGDTAEPYPLLLVRPDGIAAYYVAREALRAWGADFGYELIEQDWKLEFPPPDADLARVTRAAVQQAISEQRMARMALAGLAGRGRETFQLSPSGGGLVRSGRPGASASPSTFFGQAFGQTGSGRPQGGRAQRGLPESTRSGGEDELSASSAAGGDSATSGTTADSQVHRASAADRQPGPAAAAATAGRTDSSLATDQRPEPPRLGEYTEPVKARSDLTSLADQRGDNWALPDAARNSIPLTRPIQLTCHADRVELAAEPGGKPQSIPFAGRTQDAVDDLVSAIWEHMERWGIAGKGMYWKPVVLVDVRPAGESRFADLQALLEGSGLVLKRKADLAARGAPAR